VCHTGAAPCSLHAVVRCSLHAVTASPPVTDTI
jgi:hypothetical protein